MGPMLDGLPMIDPGLGLLSAVAFRLNEAPRAAEQIAVGIWRVDVQSQSGYMIARGPAMNDHLAAVAEGMNAALQALDVLSARGLADLVLVAPSEEHISTIRTHRGTSLRVTSTQWLGFHTSATATVIDASRNVLPQQQPVSNWHPSMRFYRESQTAEDVFASTRSLWLGLENLLDSSWPIQQGEREEAWLRRSLAAADGLVHLRRFMPAGSAKAAHNAAYEYFYAATRTHLFHAKDSRQPLLPQDRAGINYLVERHDNLTRLYLALLEALTGVRRIGGAMTYSGFDLFTRVWEESPALLVTDDDEPINEDATAVDPRGGNVSTLLAIRDPTGEVDGLKLFIGSTNMLGLARVTKIGFRAAATLMSLHQIVGDLQLGDVDEFDAVMSLRLRNPGLPRSFPVV